MSVPTLLPLLPPALARAGCCLVAAGRQLVLVDRDGVALERGSAARLDWLLAAGALALVRRLAQRLGLRDELHPRHLWVRLWRPGEDPAAAPWRRFEDALDWLAALAERPVLVCRSHARAILSAVLRESRSTRPLVAAPALLVQQRHGRAPPSAGGGTRWSTRYRSN
ncbi:MAG TPA: hypothetical protein VFS21_16210 [Roseiflexaceae bacterium]|nr:hypothetical protein [Roseiflexaceae bacterium]